MDGEPGMDARTARAVRAAGAPAKPLGCCLRRENPVPEPSAGALPLPILANSRPALIERAQRMDGPRALLS